MRLCSKCGTQGVFGTDRNTGLGYCKSHQYLRTDTDKRTPLQKALEKAKTETKVTKELRFQSPKKIHKGTFDVGVLNSDIVPVTPTPESFDGKQVGRYILDEIGVTAKSSENIGMDAFWKYAERIISKNPHCWECNEWIAPSDYRNSTGHIFMKSTFPSVADNIWNFVVVGNRCGCHHKTHTLATFSQMSIFPTAVNRYMKFGHLITENHKYLDLFLDYANQIT